MKLCLFLISLFASVHLSAQVDSLPNILLVIADDIGVDMLNGYGFGGLKPSTPTLDSLRNEGITFSNAWSAPACTPTRAAIMSGKYGVKTGVLKAPGNLDTSHTSLFKKLPSTYANALVGKWHIAHPVDLNHPTHHGVGYYAGEMASGVRNYWNWDLVENGQSSVDTNYVTSVFTDKSISWIAGQNKPWFLWLAHVTPHTPIHVPPAHMYSLPTVGTNFRQYVAMIEAFDYALGRLIDSLPDTVAQNTTLIVLGDNGTPVNFIRDYPPGHGKGTLYEGAIRVPLIVSGAGVDRKGEREEELVHVCDLYSTILELTGESFEGGIYNSLSFAHLLQSGTQNSRPTRDYNYSEIESTVDGWTIRNDRYKLIEYSNGTQEFYHLALDSLEQIDLIQQLNDSEKAAKLDLEQEAHAIRTSWSCRDHIRNGDEEGIDCGGSECDFCSNGLVESGIQDWKLYPNPGKGLYHLDIAGITVAPDAYLTVIDLKGKVWQKQTLKPGIQLLELSNLPSGTYRLILYNGSNIQGGFILKQ